MRTVNLRPIRREENGHLIGEKSSRLTKPFSIAALCVFAAAFPFIEGYSNEVSPVGSFGLGVVVIAIWLIESARKGIRFTVHSQILLLFLCWNFASLFWTQEPDLTKQRLISLSAVVALFLAVMDSARSEKAIALICGSYVLGVAIEAFDAAVNIRSTELYQGLSGRFSASGFDPNNFGTMSIVTIPLALAISFRQKKLLVFGILYSAMIAGIGIATGSRTAVLSLVLVVLGFLISAWRENLKSIVAGGCILGIGVVLILNSQIIPQASVERLYKVTAEKEGMERLDLWASCLNQAKKAPLLGHGAGITWNGESLAHNTLLSALVELGGIGFTMWVSLWGVTLWKLYREFRTKALRSWGAILFLAIIPVVIALLTLNWEVRKPAYLLLGLASAWDANLSKKPSKGGTKRGKRTSNFGSGSSIPPTIKSSERNISTDL